MTEAECQALLDREAQRIAQWRAENTARRLAEQDKAERAAFWKAIDAARTRPGTVLAWRGER